VKQLFILDAHNYDGIEEVVLRQTVRGIIFDDGKLWLVQSKFGEVKLPGGALEEGENDQEALIREIKEELGRNVIVDSIKEFGYVDEKRKSNHDNYIFHQINRLYFCKVTDEIGKKHWTKKERRYGMHVVKLTVDEAISINRRILYKEHRNKTRYNQREYKTMVVIKQYLEEHPELVDNK
jgi:8-oxo-dGTP pyrophosphatase MutT (NUDIX family)